VTTRVVEFNDVDALEDALAHDDVACVLAEPALTNIGIVLPDPGYHDALRELTRRHGTSLVIDETHCIARAGRVHLCPRPRARLITAGIYRRRRPSGLGLSAAVAECRRRAARCVDTGGVRHLAGNALGAMRATSLRCSSTGLPLMILAERLPRSGRRDPPPPVPGT
jgi:glutamate-1-semialdehyde aminotransferase